MSSYQGEKCEIQIPKASNTLIYGGFLTYLGGIFVLFAFSSPYWLVSWEYTFSPFKNMGLWEFCFENYRHPDYQFDKLFSGCHYVLGHEYREIREWILPGWLMTVQAFYTLAFMGSFGSQIILAFLIIRWPLKLILQNEYYLTMGAMIGNIFTAIMAFLTVSIFGGECYRRDWLQYPNFNYLSWSYSFAVISMFIHAFAAAVLHSEAKEAKERNFEIEGHLALQMQPTQTLSISPTSSSARGTYPREIGMINPDPHSYI